MLAYFYSNFAIAQSWKNATEHYYTKLVRFFLVLTSKNTGQRIALPGREFSFDSNEMTM